MKGQCSGGGFSWQDYQKTIKECSQACMKMSTVFRYGRTDAGVCTENGCACWCETKSNDGQCPEGVEHDESYDLYRIGILFSFQN